MNKNYFKILADKWESETSCISNPSQAMNCDSFKDLVSFGNEAIPWANERLQKGSIFWSNVLFEIIGNHPKYSQPGVVSVIRKEWDEYIQSLGFASKT